MRVWTFDLITDHDLTSEAGTDLLFGLFQGDVTPAVSGGTPLLMCSVEGPDLLTAVRATLHRLAEAGVKVLNVQLEPEAIEA